ncbi:MAG: hypothetical protein FWH33_00975 [Oscillospiraceae bacterium]|nr:hypothetical protein [Oscillospiraceae bacterium]
MWSVPLAAVVAAGLGNGVFHIGGGVDVLNISESKAGALGVFVIVITFVLTRLSNKRKK